MISVRAVSYLQTIAVGAAIGALIVASTPTLTSYSTAESRANINVCASNLKQIGLGFIQYSQDYDELMPDGTTPSSHRTQSHQNGLGWAAEIYPYVKTDSLFKCPSDLTPAGTQGTCVISYGMNSNAATAPLSAFSSPAQTVLIFEVSNDHSDLESIPPRPQLNAKQTSSSGDGTSALLHDGLNPTQSLLATGDLGNRPDQPLSLPRHLGRSNFLFSDGHVKLLTANRVSSGKNASTRNALQTGYSTGNAAATGNTWPYTFSIK